ncbi:RagB/SusD family nutrient uptake outer membrane protein [Pedobacter sp. SL55]|uniref:RagB/SusD family nutrient uptake outer membrane protein n=1 Tax=Pedobacter sp. SL55 TaxID=2995161 RepID=UPI00226F29A1|nr:RagB/SusD family nutrient uptake outer membrane protein [Pedobacter sp. SL55]WAC42248.1 RagB/SusD family nutrient uptake outer membrane protein [Pedobacter sp. SL55]
MKKIKLMITCCIAIVATACKDYVAVPPPKNLAELSRIFETDQTAMSAAAGVYAQMVASSLTFCNGGITVYAGLSSDELQNVNASVTVDAFRNNTLLADNATILATFWNNPYKNIFHINAVIEGIENSTSLSAAIAGQLMAEMRYARALHYFYMVNLFGDVPLIENTNYETNRIIPRENATKIITAVIADLLKAKEQWPYANNITPNKNRPGIDAIHALLARVYLYQGNWQQAYNYAGLVIDSNRYQLEAPNTVFLSSAKETIFSLMKPNANTAEGASFNPSSATVRPSYVLSSFLLNEFEANDKRRIEWTKTNVVSGQSYVYPYKYRVRTGTAVTENYIVQRLAELYLIRAEASAQLNDLEGAIKDLDKIRSRAGITLQATLNPNIAKPDLIEKVYKERQLELFCEWGTRWLDLKRTGKADAVLGLVKQPHWQPYAKLYPIPLSEIRKNVFLTQNDGYFN